MAVRTKKAIKAKTIKEMKGLGTYKKEYDSLIDAYVDIVQQYEIHTERHENGDYNIQGFTAAGDPKKLPIVSTLESLRKDRLAYSDRLRLNPKSNVAMSGDKPRESKLSKALANFKK